MAYSYSEKIWQILNCPDCRGQLESVTEGARCTVCGLVYCYTLSGALDLRLARNKSVQIEFELALNALPPTGVNFRPLSMNPNPEVDFSGVKAPPNVSRKEMSYIPKAKSSDSLMLDLGCGNTTHREIIEYAGFKYVGLDYSAPEAPLLGDAHALPFADNSFDFVWSAAMWQYIRYPFVMIHEVFRVLKPEGKFLGIAGTLEPFDGDSFQMFTRLGIVNLLHYGGFKVEKVTPDDWWTGLTALSQMGLFPRMPDRLGRALVSPIEGMSKLWWRLGSMRNKSATETYRLAHVTGAHSFLAVKQC